MLRFRVFNNGSPPPDLDLSAAYLVGSDSVPIRAEISYENGEIICHKRSAEPAALCLLWHTDNFGSVMLETTRLLERDQSYNLNLELARARAMHLLQKREEWGLFEIADAAVVNEKANDVRDLLLQAIIHQDDPAAASHYADKCLQVAMPLSEQTALTHAALFLQRRIATKTFARNVFGIRIDPANSSEPFRRLLLSSADFVLLPIFWKDVEPQEQQLSWKTSDEWIDFLRRAKVPIVAGPLIHFINRSIPDWLYMWEHDFETIRDLIYQHVDRVTRRYAPHVALWSALTGLHHNPHFTFSFDQIIDLTRMIVGLIKKNCPNARTLVNISQPWGEYFATNKRSIPPFQYAEMLVQSGIQVDVFGLHLRFGIPDAGCWQRDLFQISCLIDRFASLGKPVIITALQAPSAPDERHGGKNPAGLWRRPWSEAHQAKWLHAITEIALSKPFVEAICWHALLDGNPTTPTTLAHGGLAKSDLVPKQAAKTWSSLRRSVSNARQSAPPKPPA